LPGLIFLDQLGLGRSGSCWLTYRGPLGLLTNRCLETPWGYNLNSFPYALHRIYSTQAFFSRFLERKYGFPGLHSEQG